MKIVVTNLKDVVTETISLLEKEKEGDYFMNVPGVGIVRARKTSQISWQLFGIGIAKPKLIERLIAANTDTKMELELIKGKYDFVMIDKLMSTTPDAPKENASGENTKKDKKKKKSKSEENTPKVKLKQLKKTYRRSDIKNALKEVFDKKIAKKTLKLIEEELDGYGIINTIEKFHGSPMNPELVFKLFSNL